MRGTSVFKEQNLPANDINIGQPSGLIITVDESNSVYVVSITDKVYFINMVNDEDSTVDN